MNELSYFIERLGFPIFLTLYLVVRQDKLLVSILLELRRLNRKQKGTANDGLPPMAVTAPSGPRFQGGNAYVRDYLKILEKRCQNGNRNRFSAYPEEN